MHEIAFGLNVFYYIIIMFEALGLQKRAIQKSHLMIKENLIKCRVPTMQVLPSVEYTLGRDKTEEQVF